MRALTASPLLVCLLLVGLLGVAPSAPCQQPGEGEPVERYDKPFPENWLRWIFDKAVGEARRRPDTTHAEATQPGDLELSVVLWPGLEITAGDPLIARFSITNPAEHHIFLPFIGGVTGALHFEITDPEGRAVGRAYQPPPFLPDGSVAMFPAGTTKSYETIVSYWYHFTQPGEYTVDGQLIVVDYSHHKKDPVVISSQAMKVKVLPRDASGLQERCEQLFGAQRRGGQAIPVEAAPETDYAPGSDACRQALLHITDEVVLTYLALMLADYSDHPDVVSAISYVDSPKAVPVLRDIAGPGRDRSRERARAELQRLGAEAEAPRRPQAPPVAARDLIEQLCEREALAVVADLDAAEAETEVHADPAGPIPEVAAAFDAAGLRAYCSLGGKALVILGPPAPHDLDPYGQPFANASALIETITEEQLARRELGRTKGYVDSPYLTEEQIDLTCGLLGWAPASLERQQAPLERLALGIWGISGFDAVLDIGDEAILTHAGGGGVNYPLSAELLPEPLHASVLWWYWPYALSDRLEDERVSLEPVQAALAELAEREDLSGFIEVADDAALNADQELLVSAREAPVGHLVWALEVATGLQAKTQPEAERVFPHALPMWSFVTDRYPGLAERTDTLLRLPSLGYRSPHVTEAGAAILSLREPQRPPIWPAAPVYRLSSLPDILRSGVLEALPAPRRIELPEDTDYEAMAAEGRIVVLWTRGVVLSPFVYNPDTGGGSGRDIRLPAF